jgi:hypothetical protein
MTSISAAQKQQLKENGYLLLPGLVPREKIDAALQTVNHAIGNCVSWAQRPERHADKDSRQLFPEHSKDPVFLDIANEAPVWPLVEELIGPRVSKMVLMQIAPRFPNAPGTPAGKPHPHLDGFASAGKIDPFTMLLGVLLSDVPQSDAGNFTVWPGTTARFAEYFRDKSDEQILQEWQTGVLRGGVPPLELPEPVQITGKAGDVVIANYMLAHGVATNASPHIRQAIFFRLGWPGETRNPSPYDVFRQPWLNWNL